MPSRSQQEDAEFERAAKGAYTQIATAEKLRRSAVGVQQRVAKMVLKFVGPSPSRLKNDLRVLANVKLDLQSGHVALERSLRECSDAVLRENCQAEQRNLHKMADDGASDAKMDAAVAEYDRNQTARAVLTRALRTDADQTDIDRVLAALKKIQTEDGEPSDDDERDERGRYLAKEET